MAEPIGGALWAGFLLLWSPGASFADGPVALVSEARTDSQQTTPQPAEQVEFPAANCPKKNTKEEMTSAVADIIKAPRTPEHGAFSKETNYLSPQGFLAFCLAQVQKNTDPASAKKNLFAIINEARIEVGPHKYQSNPYSYMSMSAALRKQPGLDKFWGEALRWESNRDYLAWQKTGRVPPRPGRPEPIEGSIEAAWRRQHPVLARAAKAPEPKAAAAPSRAPARLSSRGGGYARSRYDGSDGGTAGQGGQGGAAAEPAPQVFAYDGGKGVFWRTPKGWTEKNQGGTAHFTASGESSKYYELRDEKRKLSVWLPKKGGESLFRRDGEASPRPLGYNVKPRAPLTYSFDNPSSKGVYKENGPGSWSEQGTNKTKGAGYKLALKEVGRDKRELRLVDADANLYKLPLGGGKAYYRPRTKWEPHRVIVPPAGKKSPLKLRQVGSGVYEPKARGEAKWWRWTSADGKEYEDYAEIERKNGTITLLLGPTGDTFRVPLKGGQSYLLGGGFLQEDGKVFPKRVKGRSGR